MPPHWLRIDENRSLKTFEVDIIKPRPQTFLKALQTVFLQGFHLFGLTQESLKTEDSDGTDKSWLDFDSFGTLREKRIVGCGRVRLLKRAFVCPP